MIRIYSPSEIPKGFQETLQMNGIDYREVRFVLHEDYAHSEKWDILKHMKCYQAIPTITEDWIYAIYD